MPCPGNPAADEPLPAGVIPAEPALMPKPAAPVPRTWAQTGDIESAAAAMARVNRLGIYLFVSGFGGNQKSTPRSSFCCAVDVRSRSASAIL